MNFKPITALSSEYLRSAAILMERLIVLKELQNSKHITEDKNLEDRIMVLGAEYSNLVNMSKLLQNYYIS